MMMPHLNALLFILAALLPEPIQAQSTVCPPEAHNYQLVLGKMLVDCVREEAAKLDRSAEKPGDIAIASLVKCKEGMSLLRKSGCGGDGFADYIEPRLRDEAIAVIVQRRAAKR